MCFLGIEPITLAVQLALLFELQGHLLMLQHPLLFVISSLLTRPLLSHPLTHVFSPSCFTLPGGRDACAPTALLVLAGEEAEMGTGPGRLHGNGLF